MGLLRFTKVLFFKNKARNIFKKEVIVKFEIQPQRWSFTFLINNQASQYYSGLQNGQNTQNTC